MIMTTADGDDSASCTGEGLVRDMKSIDIPMYE